MTEEWVECGRSEYGEGGKSEDAMRRWLIYAVVCGSSVGMGGCADQSQKPDERASDRALKDPFNYSPDMEPANISGGDTAHFDKAAFKKDWDDVFNP
jgi:hypothetical protein